MPPIPDIDVSRGIKTGFAQARDDALKATSKFDLTGGILSGISSYIESRMAAKRAKEQRRHEVDQIRNEGDERRRSALYDTLLSDWQQRKALFRRSQGLANYREFAKQSGTVKPGSHMERMLNFQSPNRITDPGAAPDPQALHGQPEGSPRRGGYKPMYTVTDDGRVESLRPNMRPKPSAIRPGG
jgi:hypothetical protein